MSAFTSVLHCILQSIHGGCSGFLRRCYNCHALNTASPPRPYHQWRPRMQPRRRCSAGISADPLHPPASSVAWRPRTTIRTPGMAHGARCLGFLLPDLSGWWPAAGQGRCTRGTGKTEADGNQGALGAAHGGARRSDGGALRRWNRRRTEGAASTRLMRQEAAALGGDG